MTRFFGTAGSVAPGPASGRFAHARAAAVRPRGCAGGSPRRSRDRAPARVPRGVATSISSASAPSARGSPPDIALGGISTKRMCRYGKKKIGPDVVDEDRPLAVHQCAGSCSAARRRPARAARTGRPAAAARCSGGGRRCGSRSDRGPRARRPSVHRWSGSGVVEVDHEADPPARDPDADADPVVGRVHQVHVVAAVGTTSRSGRTGASRGPRRARRPSGSRGSRPSGSSSSRPGGGGRRGCRR